MALPSECNVVAEIMQRVYGFAGVENVTLWQPKSFGEGKTRYLWTDAYGVCNYITLFKESGDQKYMQLAKALVSAVHCSLGYSRCGKTPLGAATEDRPCLGGLRIGKPLPEGGSMSEDGQYYHYLTKWIFALNRMFLVTKDPRYQLWSEDLASVAHRAFVKDGRMYWKMSIDLSRPLVSSEGSLDSYDGLAMYKLIQRCSSGGVLQSEVAEMQELVTKRYIKYHTHDALDAGEALWLSSWFPQEPWSITLKQKASKAVNMLWDEGEFTGRPSRRLAFREFGTTMGVQMHADIYHQWKPRVDSLHNYWKNLIFKRDSDITPVMFCSSLMPGVLDPTYVL